MANPVPVVRCSGRVQNAFFYPSPPSKKFNHPALSKVLKKKKKKKKEEEEEKKKMMMI
jgi:hypothetical protein